MGAGSRFDQPLTLIADGHQVVACGPLGFYANDVSARVTIDLEQKAKKPHRPSSGRATASGDFPNPHHNEKLGNKPVGDDEVDEWMLTATVQPYPVTSSTPASAWLGAAFVAAPPGPLVEGHGSIVYTRGDGSTHGFTWVNTGPQNPRLQAR
jgi:hypothetical protein